MSMCAVASQDGRKNALGQSRSRIFIVTTNMFLISSDFVLSIFYRSMRTIIYTSIGMESSMKNNIFIEITWWFGRLSDDVIALAENPIFFIRNLFL